MNDLLINEETMQGKPYQLQDYLKRELASQILSMDYKTIENTCNNTRMLADVFELLEEHINDNCITLKYNPMGSWFIENEVNKITCSECGKEMTQGYCIENGMEYYCSDEWLNDFMNFYNWAINNGYNDNLTLDRVNVNGNYEPINCKWSTKMEQANNRRNNVIVFYNERYLTLKELSELLNVNYRTINKQKLRGWTIEKILKKAGVNDENLLLHSRFL